MLLVREGSFCRSQVADFVELFPEEQHLDPLLELWSEMAPRREDPIDPFPDYDSEPVFSWN